MRYPEVELRRLFRPLARPVLPGSEMVTAYTDGTVTLRKNRRMDGYHEAADMSGMQGVRAGDFVVHGLDILRGSVGISDSDGAISSVCIVCAPRRDVDARYFAWAIRAQAGSGFTRALARGVREGGADFRRWDTLAELPLPCPTVGRQRLVADFLARETSRIDTLVAMRRTQISQLSERLRSEISTLVALGDEVPLRRVLALRTSGPRGWSDLVGEAGAPFLRSANLRRDTTDLKLDEVVRIEAPSTPEAIRSQMEPGDVLVGITGANTGWVGLATQDVAGGYISQHVALLRPERAVPAWIAYSIFSTQAQQQLFAGQYGGTKQQLGLHDLAELRIHLPQREVQEGVVRRLDRSRARTDRIATVLQQQVDLLQERKQALIAAAVTGQLDLGREIAEEAS